MKGSAYFSIFTAIFFAVLGMTLTLTAKSLELQILYGLFYTFITLWFLRSGLKALRYTSEANVVARSQAIRTKRQHTYIADYNESLYELRGILAECAHDSFQRHMVEIDILILEMRRDSALDQGLPYASPQQMDAALAALDLMRDKTSLDDDKIRDGADKVRRDNDPQTLKKRKAPKGVLETAARRIEAANKAEVLLLNRPKTFTW